MVTKAKQAFTPKMTHGVCTLGTKEYEDPTLGIWEFCLNQIPGSYIIVNDRNGISPKPKYRLFTEPKPNRNPIPKLY